MTIRTLVALFALVASLPASVCQAVCAPASTDAVAADRGSAPPPCHRPEPFPEPESGGHDCPSCSAGIVSKPPAQDALGETLASPGAATRLQVFARPAPERATSAPIRLSPWANANPPLLL